MAPALPPGAFVAVRAPAGALAIGMVVVVKRVEGREDVKRIVAGPGDHFTLANGTVLALGPGEYGVVGDNRGASTDSRHYGPIAREEIVAVVRVCYWPPRAWKRFKKG